MHSKDLVDCVWQKGQTVPGLDPSQYRVDDCGNLIRRNDYGNRESRLGWEGDHIIMRSKGGPTTCQNLRPLHWRPNAAGQDDGLIC